MYKLSCFRYPPPSSKTIREYHSVTQGFIVNEIFRRVDPSKRTMGEFIKEELREKLGLGLYLGIQ